MNKNLSDFIQKNWPELKEKIHSTWGRLSEDDLNEIVEYPEKLIQKIKKYYNLDTKDAEEVAKEFFSKNGFDSSSIVNMLSNAVTIKEKIFQYIDENPRKSVSVAVLGGIILAKLFF